MVLKSMNLGASPQLECWNTGIMELWVLSGIVQRAEGRE
jgi:hypothetical protein